MLDLTAKQSVIRSNTQPKSDALFALLPQVSFSEETGYEPGGVRTEFFHCLFEGMTRPEYGMFMYPKEATYMWFPVKVSPLFFAYGVS